MASRLLFAALWLVQSGLTATLGAFGGLWASDGIRWHGMNSDSEWAAARENGMRIYIRRCSRTDQRDGARSARSHTYTVDNGQWLVLPSHQCFLALGTCARGDMCGEAPTLRSDFCKSFFSFCKRLHSINAFGVAGL